MPSIAALATYGLEIAEVGGTLARHAADGDAVHAAVLLSRAESRVPITEAGTHLGVADVTFLDGVHGQLDGLEGRAVRDRLVTFLRRVVPAVALMPDPEHALTDLDPDRRPAGPLVLEALSLCGRDWREDELGAACPTPELYFYAPSHPTCVVDVTATFDRKLAALTALDYQATYSAEVLAERLGPDSWRQVNALAGTVGDDDGVGGLLAALETAHAVHHGAGGHSRAALAEAFHHSGVITLPRLM